MTEYVSLSTRGQLVIPKEARDKMGLQPGDKLTYDVTPDKITFRKTPKSYTEYMLGLHKEVWQDEDSEEYLKRERQIWKQE